LVRALPVWEGVQKRLRRQLGEHTWETLFKLTNQLTNLVVNSGGLR
jgi:hypothetical protein